MPRYIDADALYEILRTEKLKIVKHPTFLRSPVEEGFCRGISTAMRELENATTADVVPVVRCKECRWWDQKEDSPYGYCHAAKHAYYSAHWEIGIYRTYKPDWFCADGERREGDEDCI